MASEQSNRGQDPFANMEWTLAYLKQHREAPRAVLKMLLARMPEHLRKRLTSRLVDYSFHYMDDTNSWHQLEQYDPSKDKLPKPDQAAAPRASVPQRPQQSQVYMPSATEVLGSTYGNDSAHYPKQTNAAPPTPVTSKPREPFAKSQWVPPTFTNSPAAPAPSGTGGNYRANDERQYQATSAPPSTSYATAPYHQQQSQPAQVQAPPAGPNFHKPSEDFNRPPASKPAPCQFSGSGWGAPLSAEERKDFEVFKKVPGWANETTSAPPSTSQADAPTDNQHVPNAASVPSAHNQGIGHVDQREYEQQPAQGGYHHGRDGEGFRGRGGRGYRGRGDGYRGRGRGSFVPTYA